MRWLESKSCCCSTRRPQRSIRGLRRSSTSQSTRPPKTAQPSLLPAGIISPLTLLYPYIHIHLHFEDTNSCPASLETVATVWWHPPPQSPPKLPPRSLTSHYLSHIQHLPLTTRDVSHAHLLLQTQPRLFTSHSRCFFSSRPPQFHGCITRLSVQEFTSPHCSWCKSCFWSCCAPSLLPPQLTNYNMLKQACSLPTNNRTVIKVDTHLFCRFFSWYLFFFLLFLLFSFLNTLHLQSRSLTIYKIENECWSSTIWRYQASTRQQARFGWWRACNEWKPLSPFLCKSSPYSLLLLLSLLVLSSRFLPLPQQV